MTRGTTIDVSPPSTRARRLTLLVACAFTLGVGACEPRVERAASAQETHPQAPTTESDQVPERRGEDSASGAGESDETAEKTADDDPTGPGGGVLRVTADGEAIEGDESGGAPSAHVQEAELRDLPGGVVDGDTLKAVGYTESLRLLHIDTEELLHKKADRKRARSDWEGYLAEKTDEEGFATFGTPMGEEAKDFARDFFEGVDKIWLEYESPRRTEGYFERHLVYVWIRDGDQWLNYNVEAVRAGMSPYHTKYGFSERHHDEMVAAQREARQNERGIWAPDAESYPDYDERLEHFNERAEQIGTFRDRFEGASGYVDLATDTAYADLRDRLGRRAVVFGEVGYFAETRDPQRIRLRYRYQRDFLVVAFEPVEITDHDVDIEEGDYIYVEGVVSMYRGDPQLRFDDDSWVRQGDDAPSGP